MKLWNRLFFGSVEMLLRDRVNTSERYSPIYLNSPWPPFLTPEYVTASPQLPQRMWKTSLDSRLKFCAVVWWAGPARTHSLSYGPWVTSPACLWVVLQGWAGRQSNHYFLTQSSAWPVIGVVWWMRSNIGSYSFEVSLDKPWLQEAMRA